MKDKFIGTWKLVSWENRNSAGEVNYPAGKGLIGYLVYGHDGYMSVAISTPSRKRFKSEALFGGTAEEKVCAYETFLSYSGKYTVKGESIIHHIEICSFPNWAGTKQERFFKFTDRTLSLSTPPMLMKSGQEETAHLIWERA